ncbi:cysteine hydrolase [Bacillus salacetis]|uniref:Cysteine hydrolase n=1 Tax=Bacillus salacetis TaxID=2315464 RepID=A0A3A1QQ35_9BACI|nr:cysteine hydrolase family protein [Bacillus salacetis]RIW28949.1 cysteine hydrolase [Bacillus salacetis]
MKMALLIIDVQNAFNDPSWGHRNNLQAEENIKALLDQWRSQGDEVIFIQHISENPHSLFYHSGAGSKIKDIVKPQENEKIIKKQVNSAFIGTDLEKHLHDCHVEKVIVTGLTTPHCVSTSVRMSSNLGFETILISDASAAFGLYDHNGQYIDATTVHDITIGTIHKEFAAVFSTDQFLTELKHGL